MFYEITAKRRRTRFSVRNFFAWNGEGDGGAAGGSTNTTVSVTPPDDTAPKSVSAEFTPPSNTGDTNASGSIDWGNVVPQDLRDKPYIQNILKNSDPGAELFKQFDGLQKKLGERPTGVPTPESSDEDWDKFYEGLRPEKAEDYEIKPLDLGDEGKEIAEFVNGFRDEEFLKTVTALAHKHKLPKKLFEGFAQDYDKLFIDKFGAEFKAGAEARKQMDLDFDKLSAEEFGADVDKELASQKAFLNTVVSANAKKYISSLSNEALIVLASAMKGVRSKFVKEDTLANSGHSAAPMSKEEISAEGRKLMTHPAYRNTMHPEHESIKQQVDALYDQLRTKK